MNVQPLIDLLVERVVALQKEVEALERRLAWLEAHAMLKQNVGGDS